MNHKLLIVDDDQATQALLKSALKREGYEIISTDNGKEALHRCTDPNLSLILLDIMLPDMSGLDICKQIRDQVSVPILIMSARDRHVDKIIGLEFGADDYITKPFNLDEIVARVKSHLRREMRAKSHRSTEVLQFGELTINKETLEVHISGNLIPLSTKEFQILAYLAEHHHRVLSREQIYEAIWGDEFGDLNTVTVHLKNIRLKMDPEHRYIKTVWGAGYKFAWE
ncbi:response regulator transcription factor [Marinicrinis sediminis]|uniref:Response regulator transcription factor n=1 Tax=Marinicrinis sediminis TaxID=1652465 RepID=A0ABW5R6I8_9BACL